MLTQHIVKYKEYTCISLKGRIDGMTTPELDSALQQHINSGIRKFAINMKEVHYISSVGLRVFLKFQKQLSRVSGEMVIQNTAEDVLQVFSLSGFTKLFTFINDGSEPFPAETNTTNLQDSKYQNLNISSLKNSVEHAKLSIYGSTKKLSNAIYEESDVVIVDPSAAEFGLGLVALGNDYSSYSPFFGESLLIDHCCLVYPAASHASVDMMLGGSAHYNFLNGFSYQGRFSSVNLIESDEFITLEKIVEYASHIAETPVFGIVFMAESKGLWGMNLKKVPLKLNNPDLSDISAKEEFTNWFNFAIEPHDIDNLVIACGIVKKNDARLPLIYNELFSGNHHIHGAVFPEAILNKNHSSFSDELKAVLIEYECSKVQHLLKKSQFSSVMMGIVPLHIKGE